MKDLKKPRWIRDTDGNIIGVEETVMMTVEEVRKQFPGVKIPDSVQETRDVKLYRSLAQSWGRYFRKWVETKMADQYPIEDFLYDEGLKVKQDTVAEIIVVLLEKGETSAVQEIKNYYNQKA